MEALWFAHPDVTTPWFSMYENSNDPPEGIPPLGDLQGLGRGRKITGSEWVRDRELVHPVCWLRDSQVGVKVKLRVSSPLRQPARFVLSAAPTLDGDKSFLQVSAAEYTFPQGEQETWVRFRFSGRTPNELGRYRLRIEWTATSTELELESVVTSLFVYCICGEPLQPAFDNNKPQEDGASARTRRDTVTGTRARFDLLMRCAGGPARRHAVPTAEEVEAVLWNVHCAVNGSGQDEPPHFDRDHDEHITHSGHNQWEEMGIPLDLADQWLMWVKSAPRPTALKAEDRYWNDASCIGHVQLVKTMVAAAGIFTRRVWVLPTTTTMPLVGEPVAKQWRGHRLGPGVVLNLTDDDLFCLGSYDPEQAQSWRFPNPLSGPKESGFGELLEARVILAEPHAGGEFFEACLRTPMGRLLPGGYSSASIQDAEFSRKRGFMSARAVLRWWAHTTRPGFGRRFLCWGYPGNRKKGLPRLFWDREGNWYDETNYVEIRNSGLDLPVP